MDKDTATDIEDTIMGVPREFSVKGRTFFLYPPTLGKTFLIGRAVRSLGMKPEIIRVNPCLEALRLCKEETDGVCRLLAIHATEGKRLLFDSAHMNSLGAWFKENLTGEEMARLLLTVLQQGNDTGLFMKRLGIDKEKEWQSKAMKAKGDSGSLVFGGKSVYGTLIDSACERYGWTFDYVVWGISHANLQLLLADSATTVYLSDKERKKARIPKDRSIINGDDPASMARIKAMNWD